MADSTILDEEDPDQAGMMDEMCILVDIDDRARLIRKLNSLAGKVVPFIFHEKGAESWKI